MIHGKIAMFLGGTLFGTAGLKILGSRDAKKVYTHCTAATLRAKDCVAKTATTMQENAEDILAEAKQINAEREKEDTALCGNKPEEESDNDAE